MTLSEQTLESRLEDFYLDVLDFQAALLTLECLKKYWETPELQNAYPQEVLIEARDLQCSCLTQYAQELARGADFFKAFYVRKSQPS